MNKHYIPHLTEKVKHVTKSHPSSKWKSKMLNPDLLALSYKFFLPGHMALQYETITEK